MERFRACFGDLVDPRTGNAQRHDLLEMLLIALAATLCGAETCVDMAGFGRAKEPFLRRFLRLEGGIPSHDTFSRLFRLLDPDGFEASFGRFVAAFALPAGASEVVAVDGKTARRSFDRQDGRRPLHMVSAWAVGQQLVLGQQKVADASNEIEALPELLALLALDGRIVTADAMHCQRATAQAILESGGDYVLALKGNQPALFDARPDRAYPLADREPPPLVLDVVMDEDRSRSRKDHAPEHLAHTRPRRGFALNLLRANPDKGSTRGKIKRAAWNDTFLLEILTAA